MATKYTKMTDDEVLEAATKIVSQSVGVNDTTMTKERLDILRYYNGEAPGVNHKGRSKYIAQDVFDSVESMKATLLETFATGNEIGIFEPYGPQDVAHCVVASRYIDYQLFEKCNIFDKWSDQIHNGLVARIGVLKVRWDKKFEEGEEEFDGANEMAFANLLQEENVEIVDVEETLAPDGYSKLYTGTISRKSDCSSLKISTLPPESFFIEAGAENVYDAAMGDRQRMSKSELLKRGIKQSKIDEIGENDSRAWQSEQEFIDRHAETGQSQPLGMSAQDQTEKVMVYELYMDLDVEGKGMTKLWRIMYAGGVLLEKETVRRRPYIIFAPLPTPHKVIGDSYAKRIVPTQNANTMLVRGILDHTAITNNPRMTVLKGTLNDARELIDNRYGGIININRPDGIRPVEQPPLNPFVFQTMQLLDYRNEGTSAVSKLSQGLNKDAVSKQNSAAMVEQITSMSMQRQKIIARRFAFDVVKRLYELCYDIIRENEKRTNILPIAGEWVEIKPSAWPYGSRPFRVQLALGYGEKERQVNEWIGFHEKMSQDPGMVQQYTPVEKFNVWTRIFEAKGYKNIQDYIKPPDQVQPPEPDPEKVAKVQIAQQEADTANKEAQAKLLKVQNDKEQGIAKVHQKLLKDEGDHAIKDDALSLKERQFEHQVEMDKAELELERNAPELKGIASV